MHWSKLITLSCASIRPSGVQQSWKSSHEPLDFQHQLVISQRPFIPLTASRSLIPSISEGREKHFFFFFFFFFFCREGNSVHNVNKFMQWTPSYSALYINKWGVYRGMHFFFILALKTRLWGLVRTASFRRFLTSSHNPLYCGYFPEQWTEGIIIPLHKKGDKKCVNNYRGITLLSCLSKQQGVLQKLGKYVYESFALRRSLMTS